MADTERRVAEGYKCMHMYVLTYNAAVLRSWACELDKHLSEFLLKGCRRRRVLLREIPAFTLFDAHTFTQQSQPTDRHQANCNLLQ